MRKNTSVTLSTFVTTILLFLAGPVALLAEVSLKCPSDAGAAIMGVSFSAYVNRGGVLTRVDGQAIGAREDVILRAEASYNPNGTGGAVGAGFTGGTGHYILASRGGGVVNQLLSECTPADMALTLVSSFGPNSCAPPPGTTITDVKQMNDFIYKLTAADIAAGSVQFRFHYTNVTSLLPDVQGECSIRMSASLTVNVLITNAPIPQLSITKGSSVIVTVNGPANNCYQIESSSSLDTPGDWTARTNFCLGTNPFVWVDRSPLPPQRFYRLAVLH